MQEGGFALIGLYQVEGHACGNRQNKTGEAGAGPDIDGAVGTGSHERGQLQ